MGRSVAALRKKHGKPELSEREPRLVIHIGVEKTGTTSFQRYCFETKADLLTHGIIYPTVSPAFAKKTRNHAPLVAAYLRGDVPPDYSVAKLWRSREDILGALFQEIEVSKAKSVLISAEHFASRFAEPQARRLSEDFERFQPTIVIVARPHLERLYSQFATSVSNGGEMRYDDLMEALLAVNDASIAYRRTVEVWANVFGLENLRVVHLPQGGDSVACLAAAGVIPILAGAERPYRDNVGERPLAIEVLRQVNAAISARSGPEPQTYLRHELTVFARSRMLRRIGAKVGASPLAQARGVRCSSPALQRDLERAIAEDEDWLRQNCGVDLRSSQEARPEAPTTAELEGHAAGLASELGLTGYGWLQIALRAKGRPRGIAEKRDTGAVAQGK